MLEHLIPKSMVSGFFLSVEHYFIHKGFYDYLSTFLCYRYNLWHMGDKGTCQGLQKKSSHLYTRLYTTFSLFTTVFSTIAGRPNVIYSFTNTKVIFFPQSCLILRHNLKVTFWHSFIFFLHYFYFYFFCNDFYFFS